MNLNLRNKEECMFDMISLGEIMLRLDPGEGRIKTARSFRAWEGGGEYNVARGLKKCFKMDTGVITAFAENETADKVYGDAIITASVEKVDCVQLSELEDAQITAVIGLANKPEFTPLEIPVEAIAMNMEEDADLTAGRAVVPVVVQQVHGDL